MYYTENSLHLVATGGGLGGRAVSFRMLEPCVKSDRTCVCDSARPAYVYVSVPTLGIGLPPGETLLPMRRQSQNQ